MLCTSYLFHFTEYATLLNLVLYWLELDLNCRMIFIAEFFLDYGFTLALQPAQAMINKVGIYVSSVYWLCYINLFLTL